MAKGSYLSPLRAAFGDGLRDAWSRYDDAARRHRFLGMLTSCAESVVVAVVIVVVPIALCVPAMFTLIPPSVIGLPTVLAGFVEIVASFFGLMAPRAVTGDCLVEFVISFGNAALAIVVVGAK
jgi:hypothetical protein